MTIKEQNAQPTNTNIAIGSPTELIVLACKSNALRCRVPGTDSELTLRTAVRDEVPGDIVMVIPAREWTHRRHRYVAGAVTSIRSDVEALGLVPLALRDIIGELSLGPTFRDALPWSLIDNRPYLRCLHGKGLCLWRLGKAQEAAAVFHKQLWLNPSDNQGARFNLAGAEDGKTWDEMETGGW